jgi:hypothetical protein
MNNFSGGCGVFLFFRRVFERVVGTFIEAGFIRALR